LRKAQSGLGEAVEVGRPDFSAVAAQVGVAQVISQDDKNVWSRGSGRRSGFGSGKSSHAAGQQHNDPEKDERSVTTHE
jgi:hypothetical protein